MKANICAFKLEKKMLKTKQQQKKTDCHFSEAYTSMKILL